MFFIHRSFSLTTCRKYSKWLQRKALRVLTAKESEQFHSSRKKSPAIKPGTAVNTIANSVASGVIQDNVKFEQLHVGDPRFG